MSGSLINTQRTVSYALMMNGKELPPLDQGATNGIDQLLPKQSTNKESAADAGGVLGTPPAEPAGA